MIEDRPWYTYREASARVGRSLVTVKRWRRHGMAMSWDRQGRRIVDHGTLLRWLRETSERNDENRKILRDTPMWAEDLLDLP